MMTSATANRTPYSVAPTAGPVQRSFLKGALLIVAGIVCLGVAASSEFSAQGKTVQANIAQNVQSVSRVNNQLGQQIASKAAAAGLALTLGMQPAVAVEATYNIIGVPIEQSADGAAEEKPYANIRRPADETFADSIRRQLPKNPNPVRPSNPENTVPADPVYFKGMFALLSVAGVAVAIGTARFGSEQKQAEGSWLSADRESLYFRIGGDALIEPASWVFEDFILANRDCRKIFEGLPRNEQRAMQKDFVITVLGGPSNAEGLKAQMAAKFSDDEEYDALLSCMANSFQELDVPKALILEANMEAESMRDELLGRNNKKGGAATQK